MELLNNENVNGIKGWLLVYIIGSIPVLFFYSAGLSGWFLEYPPVLVFTIFLLLAIPPLLILFKFHNAPQWNITMLWLSSILIILRIVSGVLFLNVADSPTRLNSEEFAVINHRMIDALPILIVIIIFSLTWSIIWTKYFKKSIRIRNIFDKSN